jgi:hypothetical protein
MMDNDKKIAKVFVEFDDGTIAKYEGQVILIIVDDTREVFKLETTNDVDAYTVLDFAHNAIKEISEPDQPIPPNAKKRPNHLRVVK